MTLQIPRVTRPPKLEDFLKSLPREAETLITDFRQRSPGDGVSVSEQTSAYLSYDDKNLYVIFVCKEEAGKVRARMAKREDISDDDEVAVYLDTFHDRQRAYVFAANPLGIQRDGVISEGQGDDFKFDTLWHSEARLTDQGFTVWMAIPFKSLRFSNGPVQSWGIALRRFIPRNNESSFWPYITRRLQGLVQQMATLGGLEAASAGRNVQLIPYASFTSARLLDPQAPSFSTTNDWRAGFDAKAVIRNAFTLDATVNPDFSQVESDDPQVTVNRRFEVFFPEKRPFFIENAGFFQTPTNLFFSRRIADPEFGARLTGKVGRWAIGALAADDRAPGTQIQATDPLYGSRAGFGVARIQREFGDRSSFGMLATSRDFGPSSNRVISLDTRLKFSPNLFFTGQAAQSFDRQLDGKQVQGPAYFAGLDYSGKHLSYSSSYTDRSPDFRTLTGFVNRVDVRWIHNSAGYMWQPEGSRLLSFGPSVSGGTNWDRQGRLQDWYVNTDFRMDFTGPTRVTLSHYDAFELYLDKGYRQGSNGISLDTTLLKWLSVGGFHYQGTGINYSPPDGITPFLANSTNSSFRTTLRPTPRFRLDEIYYFSRLETRPGATPSGFSDSTDIFTNHLIRTRINYQFSRALSLRTILDYYAILPDSSLITQERFKRITGDILLTYLLNPGTALYVGYTDRFENLLLDPTIPSGVIPTLSPKTSTARQLFIKLSYLFQF